MLARAESFAFAAIGDVPYGPPEQLGRLITQINREAVAFTIHVGDIKSGGSRCTDEHFVAVRELFAQAEQPLIYTPGDNEWTDCHRRSNGGYDPLERLQKIRELFFSTDESFGRRRITLSSQASQKAFRPFVENRRWSQQRVRFATVHLVGSNNNLQPELPSSSEFAAREAANLAWLRDTFAEARAQNDVAIVLAMQADTFFGDSSGVTRWVDALAEEAARWGKPVLLVQGDTHIYRSDRPLRDARGKVLANVQRIVVPGEQVADAVLIEVDTAQPEPVFRWRLMQERGTR